MYLLQQDICIIALLHKKKRTPLFPFPLRKPLTTIRVAGVDSPFCQPNWHCKNTTIFLFNNFFLSDFGSEQPFLLALSMKWAIFLLLPLSRLRHVCKKCLLFSKMFVPLQRQKKYIKSDQQRLPILVGNFFMPTPKYKAVAQPRELAVMATSKLLIWLLTAGSMQPPFWGYLIEYYWFLAICTKI